MESMTVLRLRNLRFVLHLTKPVWCAVEKALPWDFFSVACEKYDFRFPKSAHGAAHQFAGPSVAPAQQGVERISTLLLGSQNACRVPTDEPMRQAYWRRR